MSDDTRSGIEILSSMLADIMAIQQIRAELDANILAIQFRRQLDNVDAVRDFIEGTDASG